MWITASKVVYILQCRSLRSRARTFLAYAELQFSGLDQVVEPTIRIRNHPFVLNMRYAIVTPYYKEPRDTLERCMRSVRNQTVQTDHILVADGYPQDWIDTSGVRHLRLDRAHGDFGNTPRGMGAMMAIAEQYDGIGLLDADNWLESEHVATCVATFNAASAQNPVDYVVAKRYLRRLDETIMPINDEPIEQHVDTNCFFFFPGSYPLVPHFGLMPKELSPIGDRIFYQAMRSRGLRFAVNAQHTVNYQCMWESVYLSLGEQPPHGAKPNIDGAVVQAWINSRSPSEQILAQRLAGILP